MLVDLPSDLYRPVYDFWARPVTVTPMASQPGHPAYASRGILKTNETDIVALDGSIISDSKIVLAIIIDEYPTPPMQRDIINIPPHMGLAGGIFEVSDLVGHALTGNSGGELVLVLKEIVVAKPPTMVGSYSTASPDFGHPVVSSP
jgi:hypothetical protein